MPRDLSFDGAGVNFEEVMGRVESLLLQEALRNCDGNKAKAAICSAFRAPRWSTK